MIRIVIALFATPWVLLAAGPEMPPPSSVAVLYNSADPESLELAEFYAETRGLPAGNLVGLPLPETEEISRKDFDTLLKQALAAEFDRRGWWERGKDANGSMQLLATRIRIIACMRGVPLKVKHPDPPVPKPEAGQPVDPNLALQAMLASGSASVDSELCLLGFDGYNLGGALDNPYFRSEEPISTAKVPMFLVGRIDGPNARICRRLITDAVETEQHGLWGFGVVDVANKSVAGDPNGDPWFKNIALQLGKSGIPVLVDRFNETLPVNFPLPRTAVYYGWYDGHVSGPFKSPGFRFSKGAVAVHLHSFSAAQLRSGGRNWCAPLLSRGAAATVGNTYEPFLHLTHHLDVFHDRLVRGFTLVEAAAMAMPAVSWQGVVLGDPLYRPFLRLDGSGEKRDEDREFRALRLARMRWGDDPATREAKLREAALRMNSPTLLEALGLDLAEEGRTAEAAVLFTEAGRKHQEAREQLRTALLIAKLDRENSRKASAVDILRRQKLLHPQLPEAQAADAWLRILEPPAKPAGK